jgi:hypothetical protein
VPVITITGLQLGLDLIAFAIITETVFQWPGMGLLFIQAVQFADIPVMAAYLCLIALIFVVINLVVDLLYFVVDPRLRIERDRRPLTHARIAHAAHDRLPPPARFGVRADRVPARPARAPGAGLRGGAHGWPCRRGAAATGVDEMHTGIGKTGVVGVIRGSVHRQAPRCRSVGLRADMDALPMREENDFAWRSARNPG